MMCSRYHALVVAISSTALRVRSNIVFTMGPTFATAPARVVRRHISNSHAAPVVRVPGVVPVDYAAVIRGYAAETVAGRITPGREQTTVRLLIVFDRFGDE